MTIPRPSVRARVAPGLLGGLAAVLAAVGVLVAQQGGAPTGGSAGSAVDGPRQAAARVPAATATPLTVRVVTYNTLGSLRTEPGGDLAYRMPADLRAQLGADTVRSLRPDVVGHAGAAAQPDRRLPSRVPRLDAVVGLRAGQHRPTDRDHVERRPLHQDGGGSVDIPSMGITRRMSWVQLQDKASGRQFAYFNIHNSPGSRQSERDEDLRREVAVITQLRATGLPVIFAGDMNEHEHALCTVTTRTDLVAASGGSVVNGVCKPPPASGSTRSSAAGRSRTTSSCSRPWCNAPRTTPSLLPPPP